MIGRESSYVDYMKAAPGFSVWQNFVPTKANFYAIGQIFIVANGQIMKQNQAIWSHCFAASPPPLQARDYCRTRQKSFIGGEFVKKREIDRWQKWFKAIVVD